MKRIIFFTTLIFVISSFAADSKGEGEKSKTYTQAEFLDAVDKETTNRLKKYSSQNMVELTRELMKKEREIELREQEVTKKQDELKAVESDIQKKIKEFQSQQQAVLGCLDANDKNQRSRVNHMVEVVSGMRPATAADVLSVQDVEIAVQILGKLEATKVSKIFNSMDKEISARLQKQFMNMKK